MRKISFMRIFKLVVLVGLIQEVRGKQIFKLEAENFWKSFIYRQSASQDKTVSLNENDAMSIPFCLRRKTTIAVNSVLYTNDGLPNIIAINIDSTSVGEVVSHNRSERGKLWNVVSSTGQIGKPLVLQSGPHKIHLHIRPTSENKRTDPFGIEIDAVFLEIDDNDISGHYLHCFNTLCSEKITYSDRHVGRDDIPSGRIVQMSRPSNCLEEDNIKIPIYHENIRQFRISAVPPRYKTFWTFKDAQFDGCPEYSRYHWQYMGVECNPSAETRTFRSSEMSFGPSGNLHSDCKIVVRFDLQGISFGQTEAHIGDILEIAIHDTSKFEIIVQPQIGVTRNGSMIHVGHSPTILNNEIPYGQWKFPDFTWTEMSETAPHLNEISINVPSGTVLNYMRLGRREENLPDVLDIYDNQQLKIQRVKFDYWWRDPAVRSGQEEEMKVYVKTLEGEVYKGTADYIVFIEKRMWSPDGNMDQTFVLYQDGSARILPIAPHGLNSYVPYGNDIVIGQANPAHMRPNAPIKKLVFQPETHNIDVFYNDGGTATLNIYSSVEETNITLTNVKFVKDQNKWPFAVFRSTWVEDGRAKVDHVTVNGVPAKHIILDSWSKLYGTSFVFFRRCISVYNSQSPDYSVEILTDSEVKYLKSEKNNKNAPL